MKTKNVKTTFQLIYNFRPWSSLESYLDHRSFKARKKKKEIILKDTKITFHLPSPLSPLTFPLSSHHYSCKYKKKGK